MSTVVSHKDNQSVNIISLDNKGIISALYKKFLDLGKTVNVINLNQWQHNVNRQHKAPTVLLLSENNFYTNEELNFISNSSLTFLAIYSHPATHWVKKIIFSSAESCVWPCPLGELEYRFDRLLLKLNNSNIAVNTDEWSKLNLVGDSCLFRRSLQLIYSSANCEVPVLIEGETGTGKEMAARAIHNLSHRKENPFIAVNCGAIPDQLFENEFFGHEKRAYADARQSQEGLVAQADSGTLFLDEIETLTAKGQVTLLRFIEDHLLKPLGANKSKYVNVRIVAASNINLSELVEKGLFRQDLLFRLNLIVVKLPSLREREGDIKHLTEHFLEKFRIQYQQTDKFIESATYTWMINHSWPGNVRELENFIHRLFLISDDLNFQTDIEQTKEQYNNSRRKLFDRRASNNLDVSFTEAKNNVVNQFEEKYLTHLISNAHGNVSLAADIAKKERSAFGKLLKKHQIDPNQFRLNK